MKSVNPECILLGGGGHARVLIDLVQVSGVVHLCGILDPNPALWGTEIMGVKVLGKDDLLPELVKQGVETFIIGVGGVGNNVPRLKLFEFCLACGLYPLTLIHPSAVCSQWAEVGVGSQILPAAVINVGAVLGKNVLINSGAIVEHDCWIGDHAHISTGARLCGDVRVEDLAHVGAGATIKQGIKIGKASIVGAGAVVINDVPAYSLVVGVPAHPIKNNSTLQTEG